MNGRISVTNQLKHKRCDEVPRPRSHALQGPKNCPGMQWCSHPGWLVDHTLAPATSWLTGHVLGMTVRSKCGTAKCFGKCCVFQDSQAKFGCAGREGRHLARNCVRPGFFGSEGSGACLTAKRFGRVSRESRQETSNLIAAGDTEKSHSLEFRRLITGENLLTGVKMREKP